MTEIKKEILNKIKAYNRIVIMRHIRPDGDAVGSTLGLQRILKLTYPEKEILVVNDDRSDYMSFLGDEDAAPDNGFYADALGIVLDTATTDRISNKNFTLCRELIKIDHHVDIKPYGDISWVEDRRSSLCEMITDFYITFSDELKLDTEAATCLYAGMVTDSGRFKYSCDNGEPLRCAAVLLDKGIDTELLYAELYLDEFSFLKYKAYILNRMKETENGVAYLFISQATQTKFLLSSEQASNAVSFLDSISGDIIWIAFIENSDGSIRVRLRSRFVTINKLAEKYGGGGHECASGATVKNRRGMNAILKDADALIRDYKSTHEGWL